MPDLRQIALARLLRSLPDYWELADEHGVADSGAARAGNRLDHDDQQL